MVAGRSHAWRVTADDPLGEFEQVVSGLVQIRVVAAKLVVAAGYPFHEQHIDGSVALGPEGGQQLVEIAHQPVFPAKLFLGSMRVTRLDD